MLYNFLSWVFLAHTEPQTIDTIISYGIFFHAEYLSIPSVKSWTVWKGHFISFWNLKNHKLTFQQTVRGIVLMPHTKSTIITINRYKAHTCIIKKSTGFKILVRYKTGGGATMPPTVSINKISNYAMCASSTTYVLIFYYGKVIVSRKRS